MLIAEGSDWNWWYGPEHHSANDRDFDELYRKHLSNVYQALGARSAGLSGSAHHWGGGAAVVRAADGVHSSASRRATRCGTSSGWARPSIPPITAPARCTASSSCWTRCMPESMRANLYGRLDFSGKVPAEDFEIVVNVESWATGEPRPRRTLRVERGGSRAANSRSGRSRMVQRSVLASSTQPEEHVKLALLRNFEFKLPLAWLLATPTAGPVDRAAERKAGAVAVAATSKLQASLQPVEKPSACRFVAGGGMDRIAGGQRRGVDFRGVKDFLKSKKKPETLVSGRFFGEPERITCRPRWLRARPQASTPMVSGRFSSSVSSVPAGRVAERCLASQCPVVEVAPTAPPTRTPGPPPMRPPMSMPPAAPPPVSSVSRRSWPDPLN